MSGSTIQIGGVTASRAENEQTDSSSDRSYGSDTTSENLSYHTADDDQSDTQSYYTASSGDMNNRSTASSASIERARSK